MIKLPGHVYSPNSEASVSNDGKIPGFCKFLFLSSVIKFDNKMSKVKTKITIAQLLRLTISLCKVKIYSPRRLRRYLSPGNSIIFEIAATLLFIFSLILGLILMKLKHASNRPVYFREPFPLTEQYLKNSPISHFNLKLENSIHNMIL